MRLAAASPSSRGARAPKSRPGRRRASRRATFSVVPLPTPEDALADTTRSSRPNRSASGPNAPKQSAGARPPSTKSKTSTQRSMTRLHSSTRRCPTRPRTRPSASSSTRPHICSPRPTPKTTRQASAFASTATETPSNVQADIFLGIDRDEGPIGLLKAQEDNERTRTPSLVGPGSDETQMAEREGFEPSVRANAHTISSRAHSAALAPLLGILRRGILAQAQSCQAPPRRTAVVPPSAVRPSTSMASEPIMKSTWIAERLRRASSTLPAPKL